MQDVRAVATLPVLASDAFMAYLCLLRELHGVSACVDGDGANGRFLEAVGGWRDSVRDVRRFVSRGNPGERSVERDVLGGCACRGNGVDLDGLRVGNDRDGAVVEEEVRCADDGLRDGVAGSVDRVSSKTLANREKRRKAKERKTRRKSGLVADLPTKVEIVAEPLEWRRGVGRNGKPLDRDATGFWKSCSEDTRRKLIESKAKMHIANNIRRAKEDEERVAYLESPQAIVDKVTSLVVEAEKRAGVVGDSKIMGWAKTVTSSSAESLARSVPSTVPSFDSVSSAVDEARALELQSEVEHLVTEKIELAMKLQKVQETCDRLQRERFEAAAPKAVAGVRKLVPNVVCAPVRRQGETVNQHIERIRKYKEIQDRLQPVF